MSDDLSEVLELLRTAVRRSEHMSYSTLPLDIDSVRILILAVEDGVLAENTLRVERASRKRAQVQRDKLAGALRQVLPFATHRIQQIINQELVGTLYPRILYGHLEKASAALAEVGGSTK